MDTYIYMQIDPILEDKVEWFQTHVLHMWSVPDNFYIDFNNAKIMLISGTNTIEFELYSVISMGFFWLDLE